MKPVTLFLPFPPSVNTYWRHVGNRTLLSKKGRQYKKDVAVIASQRRSKKAITQDVSVRIDLVLPDRRRRDVDNYSKAILDALTDCGVWTDDSQIQSLLVLKSKPEQSPHPAGTAVVTIY